MWIIKCLFEGLFITLGVMFFIAAIYLAIKFKLYKEKENEDDKV